MTVVRAADVTPAIPVAHDVVSTGWFLPFFAGRCDIRPGIVSHVCYWIARIKWAIFVKVKDTFPDGHKK